MKLLKLSRDHLYPALEEPQVEVSLEEWRDNPQGHADATALRISNATSLADVKCDIHGFSVIILDFPAFKDGRAYSQARLLRERYGYAGEIRARGDILRDQILFMTRCGFDAFEFSGADAQGASDALRDFSFSYQAAADGATPVWRKRLSRAVAA
ncbi:DUF934 domain-containing protein [Hyphococcus sp.]|uniref:DUF934 domain-containing protein n=1 Tax=Hyphococcus sp. TaxID=2038636 RepID=UPI0020866A60|nr:MAG: oxidoreductase [Marinicaulis sp.]